MSSVDDLIKLSNFYYKVSKFKFSLPFSGSSWKCAHLSKKKSSIGSVVLELSLQILRKFCQIYIFLHWNSSEESKALIRQLMRKEIQSYKNGDECYSTWTGAKTPWSIGTGLVNCDTCISYAIYKVRWLTELNGAVSMRSSLSFCCGAGDYKISPAAMVVRHSW